MNISLNKQKTNAPINSVTLSIDSEDDEDDDDDDDLEEAA